MTSFRSLQALADGIDRDQNVEGKIESGVLASIETALNIVPVADREMLAAASRSAKKIHDHLGGADDALRTSAAYLAGRMASLCDLLGIAAQRCVPSTFDATVSQDRYCDILVLLAGTRMRNVDVARRTGCDEATVCRKLQELRELGAVIASRSGRDAFNSLSPAAEAIAQTMLSRRGRGPTCRPFDDARRSGGSREEGPPVISATPERAGCGADA